MSQIPCVTSHGRNQRDAERGHACEYDANGCVLLNLCVFGDQADAECRENGSYQCPPEELFF